MTSNARDGNGKESGACDNGKSADSELFHLILLLVSSFGPIPSPWMYYAPVFRLGLRLYIVVFYAEQWFSSF